MFTLAFWKNLLPQAIAAFAAALLSALGNGAVNVLQVPWLGALSIALGAALVVVLTNLAKAPANVALKYVNSLRK